MVIIITFIKVVSCKWLYLINEQVTARGSTNMEHVTSRIHMKFRKVALYSHPERRPRKSTCTIKPSMHMSKDKPTLPRPFEEIWQEMGP